MFNGPDFGLHASNDSLAHDSLALVQVTYEEALTYFMGLDLSHLRKDLPKRQRRSMLSMCCGRPQVGWHMYILCV